jgi:hypothetical protein
MRMTPQTVASTLANESAFLAGDQYRAWTVTLDAAKVTADTSADKKVKAGTVLGKITATGLYAPVKKSTTATTQSTGDSTVTAATGEASFFQVGDVISIGSITGKTITAINTTTNVITISSTLGASVATGDVIKTADGLGTAVAVLFNSVNLKDGNSSEAGVFEGAVYTARLTRYNASVWADLATKFHARTY